MQIPNIIVAIFVLAISTPSNAATCDIHDILARDVSVINQSNDAQLAFVLTASEAQYNEAKKNGASGRGYALFATSLTYNSALERARGIAEATKFDYKYSYAKNFFDQNVTPSAVNAYVACIGSSVGLHAWLDSRQGDFLTFGVLWVSPDAKTVVSPYDTAPVIDGGRIVSKPDAWQSGKSEQIVVKKDGNSDVYLRLKVNGQISTKIIVKDPPPVIWERAPVTSQVLMRTGSHGPNPGCSGGEVADCVFPLHPGGALILDSATLIDRKSSDPTSYSETYYLKSPNQICVKMRQSTGACEVTQTAEGRLTALEEFPRAAP